MDINEAFVRGLWSQIPSEDDPSWVALLASKSASDEPFGDYGPLLRKMRASGLTDYEIARFAKIVAFEAVHSVCYYLEDPAGCPSFKDPRGDGWRLYITKDDSPTDFLSGLHEILLSLDPSGREMSPLPEPESPNSRQSVKIVEGSEVGKVITGKKYNLARINVDYSKSVLTDCEWTNCQGNILDLTGATLKNCHFIDCDLHAYFSDASFENCSFQGSRFHGCKSMEYGGVRARFAQCNFQGAVFSELILRACKFTDCETSELTIRGGDLRGASHNGTPLTKGAKRKGQDS